jgi:hypothetical protein
MMETTDLEMAVIPTANLSAVTEFLTPMSNATKESTTLTPRPMNVEPTADSSLVVMVSLTSARNATPVAETATPVPMLAEPLANSQFVVTEWSIPLMVRLAMMATQLMETDATVLANPSAVTERSMELKSVMTEAATPTLFQMHAVTTAEDQDAEMVFVTLMSNAIPVPTPLDAKAALLDAEMVSWSLERNVITESTTLTLNQPDAELTAVFLPAVMESSTLSRSATTELLTETLPTDVVHGAVSPSVVTVLLMLETRKLAMMEILLTEMVAIHAANASAETAVLTLVSNAMLELEILIPDQLAAVLPVPSQSVEMVLLTSVRNATMEETIPLDQIHADLIAPCLSVVTESLITFTEKSATKDQETLGPPLMDALQPVLLTFAARVLL